MGKVSGRTFAIGIDIGTTHIKVCAVDEGGRLAAFWETDQEITEIPAFGRGMDCTRLMEKVDECLKQVLGQIDRGQVIAIGITGMAEAGVPIDRAGQPMGPILAWNSPPREEALPEELSGFHLYRRTGLRYHPKYTLNRIRWYAKEKPDIFRAMKCFLSTADYIAFCLSGVCMTEESLASRTMLYNLTEGDWDRELTAYAGVEGRLPGILKPGDTLPQIEPEQAQRYGLPSRVRVCVSGHDHLCGALAEGLKEGEILNSMGTSEVYLGFLPRPELSEEYYERGILQGHFHGRTYFMSNLPSSGASIEWLRNFLAEGEKPSYEKLMKAEPARPSPVTYLPFVNGGGSHRSPSAKTGMLLGITGATDRVQVLQAINEGIACEAGQILKGLEEVGIRTETVIAIGGGTANRRLMQAKADITGSEFLLDGNPQNTVIGAALKAGGFEPEKRSCCKRVGPDQALRKAYQMKIKEYEELVHLLYQ